MRCFALLLLVIFLTSFGTLAQSLNLELNASGVGNAGVIRLDDPSRIGDKSGVKIDYSDIRGNCFLFEDWKPATIKLTTGGSVKFSKLKVNMYAGQIHYFDKNSVELVSGMKLIERISFVNPQDSTGISNSLKKMPYDNNEFLFQVLTSGKYELLKRTTVTLLKGQYDVTRAKNDYRFVRKYDYFFVSDRTVNRVEELSKNGLNRLLTIGESDEKWLRLNKNKLKNEAEVLDFLNYINNRQQ
jgi:hypothetical protein